MRPAFDAFEIIGRVPKEKAYQWIAETVLGDKECVSAHRRAMMDAGWKPVPAKRHPKMHRVGSRIALGGLVLMERRIERALAARKAEIDCSLENVYHDKVGKFTARQPKFRASDEQWAAFEPVLGPFPSTDGQPKIVEVSLGIKLGNNLVEAAAICCLSVEEYARRMVALVLRGDLPGLLAPTLERDAFELRDLSLKETKG